MTFAYTTDMTFDDKVNYFKAAYGTTMFNVLREQEGTGRVNVAQFNLLRHKTARRRAINHFQALARNAGFLGYSRVALIFNGVVMALFEQAGEYLPGGDAGMYPAAHPRPEAAPESGDSVYHDEFGQGTTRFYHSFGAVRMARVCWQTGRESSVPVDTLHYTMNEDAPRTENIGGGNPAAVLDTPEVLGAEYDSYRSAVDMAERIEAGGHISAAASLALAQHLVDAKCTADKVFIATACYGFDTNLYGVIFPARGVWYLVCGWLKRDGTLHVVDTDFHVDVTLVRRTFGFSHREALIVEVNI